VHAILGHMHNLPTSWRASICGEWYKSQDMPIIFGYSDVYVTVYLDSDQSNWCAADRR